MVDNYDVAIVSGFLIKCSGQFIRVDLTVQTGCYRSSFTVQSIHLREKNIASPTERSKTRSVF